jgi:peroxiredoxin
LDETPSLSSSIRLENGIQEGDSAVDFSLNDVRGETHQLSDMLETKPVLLVLGGYT